MKIYALRDRLLDYYMTPFAAPNHNEVLSSIAATINTGETTNAIAQAPHHFEIWHIGTVTEGHITPTHELVADCASLIRGDIRGGGRNNAGRETLARLKGESTGQPGGDRGSPHTGGAAV